MKAGIVLDATVISQGSSHKNTGDVSTTVRIQMTAINGAHPKCHGVQCPGGKCKVFGGTCTQQKY